MAQSTLFERKATLIENEKTNSSNPDVDLSHPNFQTEDSKIKIYQADALAFLRSMPANSVDIIVTEFIDI